jgi:hypothetical protein
MGSSIDAPGAPPSPGITPEGSSPQAPVDPPGLLEGAIVQRADVGERSAVLKVRQPGATTFVVVAAGRGVGLVRGRPAKPEGGRSLGRLEGFRVAWVRESGVGLARGDMRARIDGDAAHIGVHVGEEAWSEEEGGTGRAEAGELDAWLARGGAIAGDAARDALAARRVQASRAVKRAVTRLARRAEAVRGDLARAGDAEALAHRAQWLVAEASRAPRGARSLTVADWSTGEAKTIEVPLDPSKPARAQVEAMFQRARRLKLGAKIAGERLAQAEAALAALGPIEERIARAEDVGAIELALAAARAAAPKDVKLEPSGGGAPGGRAPAQTRAPPFRTFHARTGARLLVGRGAAHNDTLTFQIARPHDLWLHAKGHPGAHVIVPLAKSQSCPGDVLADAAHLAAHFSDARDEAVVDVQYATRRHLRKPRGSAPGLVVVDREKVIAVRMEPAVLRALLESEEG